MLGYFWKPRRLWAVVWLQLRMQSLCGLQAGLDASGFKGSVKLGQRLT